MKKVDFTLIPFDLATAPDISISGNILRHQDLLKIEYVLRGDLDGVIIPPLKAKGDRYFDLWEHTCFECFLAIKDTLKYWEFNLAPNLDWNVFRFLHYRYNIAEETNFNSLSATIVQEKDCLKLAFEVELAKIISSNIILEIGITAVIEEQHQISYWALKHLSTEADFHNRDSFVLLL